MEGVQGPTPNWEVIGSWPLLGEGEPFFSGVQATGKLFMLLQMTTPTHIWDVLIGHSISVKSLKEKTQSQKEHILRTQWLGEGK